VGGWCFDLQAVAQNTICVGEKIPSQGIDIVATYMFQVSYKRHHVDISIGRKPVLPSAMSNVLRSTVLELPSNWPSETAAIMSWLKIQACVDAVLTKNDFVYLILLWRSWIRLDCFVAWSTWITDMTRLWTCHRWYASLPSIVFILVQNWPGDGAYFTLISCAFRHQ